MRIHVSSLLALIVLGTFSSGWAEEQTLELDPAATSIDFVLDATMHKVQGSLHLERGSITFGDTPGPARGEVAVDVLSADTGNARRDRVMHGDVLRSVLLHSKHRHCNLLSQCKPRRQPQRVKKPQQILC